MTDQEKIERLEAQVAALKARLQTPHNYVMVPSSAALPEPDFDACAAAATEATGLPDMSGHPWLNIFVREVRRWAAHQAFHQATKSPWHAISVPPRGYAGEIVLKSRDGEHRVGSSAWLIHDDSIKDRYVGWMPLPPQETLQEAVYPVMDEQLIAACFAYKPTYRRDMPAEQSKHEANMRNAIEAAVGGLEHRALQAVCAAVDAVYFDDGHDFKPALHKVVVHLFPKLGEMLQQSPAKAYRLFHPESESKN